ncbi:MAG TPA: cytochrome c biogenesis protein [Bacteroidia bacterium]|nr:cytochrome c biogenesis protein [Bacteroidia bacterium]
MNFKQNWYKVVAVLLVFHAIISGMLMEVPRMPILNETIRNLYYHVTIWFSMMLLLSMGLYHSIKVLRSGNPIADIKAVSAIHVAYAFGLIGIFTGMIWAKFTWGAYWISDAKLNGAAATLLVYAAYFILRNSIDDEQKKARISAIYSIFAYVMMLVFIMILPRMTDSLHPGNGGNPGFSTYDLDHRMRGIFYPAIIGWFMLSLWIFELRSRYQILNKHLEEDNLI